MLNMEKVFAVTALVILGVTATDAAYGAAPPGSRGSIDFRYPDYIVKPLVPCPYEGVFPHPRNCTWYYRCYDRYSLGFFNRAYFECEPGTVFSDALDQCVFGYVNENCSPISLPYPGGTGGIINPYVTPAPGGGITYTPMPGGVTYPYVTPKPGGITYPYVTPPGVMIDPYVTPQPVTIAPEVKCSPKIDQCSTGAFCPSQAFSTQHVEEVDVCRVAELQCTNGTRAPFCPSGHFLSRKRNLCFPDNSLCKLDPRPENYSTVCEDVVENCWDTYVCPDDATLPQLVRRCQVVQVCTTGSKEVSRQPVCGDGGEFDPSSNLCHTRVAAFAGCSPSVQVGPLPPPPQCSKQAELCSEMSLCNDAQQAALVCRQRFSCSAASTSALQQPGYPVPGLTCVPVLDLPSPSPSCTVNTGECFMAAFCPAGITSSVFVAKFEVCRSAVRVCSGATLRSQVCEGQLYDVQNERCVSSSGLCGPVVRPLAAIVCEDVLEDCRDDTVCIGPRPPQQVRTCNLVTVCYQDGAQVSRTSVCPPGSTFDAIQNQCIQSPQPGSCPSGVAPPATVPNCGVESETCAVGPVCDSDDKALVCRRYFSCEEPLSGSIYPSKPVSPSTVAPQCEKIPLPVKPPSCSEKLNQCKTASLCPVAFNSSAFVPSVKVCYEAMTVCDDGTSSPVCTTGQVYSVPDKQCIPEAILCGALPTRNPSSLICEYVIENCQDKPSCPDASQQTNFTRTCDMFRVCYRDDKLISRESKCPGGHYDVLYNECVDLNPGIFRCELPVPTSLPQPTCGVVDELCGDRTECGTREAVLVCERLFACEGPPSNPLVTSLRASQADVACVEIPGAGPPVCSVAVDQCEQRAVCPAVVQSSMFVSVSEVCAVASNDCSDGTSTPLCPPGNLYDKAQQSCISETSLCGPSAPRPDIEMVCTDEFGGCEDLFLCPSSPELPEVARRCDLNRVCRVRGEVHSNKSLCPAQKFDAAINQCVANPDESVLCPSDLPLPQQPAPKCTNVTEVCTKKPICDSTDTALVCYQLFLCQDAYTAFVRSNVFGIDMEAEDDCVKRTDNTFSETTTIKLDCSVEGEIPITEEFKTSRCMKDAMCSPPKNFKDIRESCKEYYQCKIVGGSLTPVLQTCPGDQVLEVASKTCEPVGRPDYLPCSLLPSATGTEMPEILEITTTTTTSTSKPTSELFPQEFNTTLLCTRDKEIPVNDDVLRINCDPVPLCNEVGMFLGNQVLCSRFYVCRWDAVAGHFYLEDSVCSDPTKLFSYESGSCVFPANACRV